VFVVPLGVDEYKRFGGSLRAKGRICGKLLEKMEKQQWHGLGGLRDVLAGMGLRLQGV
jgi:hypothetical protein